MSEGGAQYKELGPYFDSSGNIYPSPKLYHYEAGSTTNKDIYSDEGKALALAQPFIGDTSGLIAFYGDGLYDFKITDSDGNVLYTRESVWVSRQFDGIIRNATAFPSVETNNTGHLAVKKDASNNPLELGYNNGTSFQTLIEKNASGNWIFDSNIYLKGPWHDVKAYGAVADGTTDDTTAITNAIAAAEGGTLYFPYSANEYIVTGLTVNVKCRIVIDPGATIKLKDSSNSYIFWVTADYVEILGGKLDCNKANNANGYGIQVSGDNVKVDSVVVQDAGKFGIYYVGTENGTISNNIVIDSNEDGIEVINTSANDYSNCYVVNNFVDREDVGIAIAYPGIRVRVSSSGDLTNTKVIGNHVLMPASASNAAAIGIEVSGATTLKTVVANNTVENGYDGIKITNAQFCNVTGNAIYNPTNAGISNSSSDFLNIVGNTIDCNSTGDFGILVAGTAPLNNNISDNTIDEFEDTGIHVTNATHTNINSNTLRTAQSGSYGIFTDVVSESTVNGNSLYLGNATDHGIYLRTTHGVTVNGNYIDDPLLDGIVFYDNNVVQTLDYITVTNNVIEDARALSPPGQGPIAYAFSAASSWGHNNKFKNNTTSTTNIPALGNDATPSVFAQEIMKTGGVITITDLDDGVTGQILTIIAEHSIDITDGTNIFLNGSANFSMTATDTLTVVCKEDNKWYEMGRGDNGA